MADDWEIVLGCEKAAAKVVLQVYGTVDSKVISKVGKSVGKMVGL